MSEKQNLRERGEAHIPKRNCDVGSVVEQRNRFVKYCKGQRIKIIGNADVCNPKCPCLKYGDFNLCVLAWSQMPFESEAEKMRLLGTRIEYGVEFADTDK